MKSAGSSVENFFEKFCVDNDWISNEFCMDTIIRFENLLIDLEKICNNLNVKFDKNKLVHFKKNLSSKVDYSSFYTNKSIDIVTKAYEFELENFNYKLPW